MDTRPTRFGVTVIFAPDVPGGYRKGAGFSNTAAYLSLKMGAFDPGMVIEIEGTAKTTYYLLSGRYRVKPKNEWVLFDKRGDGYKPKDSLEAV